jgi:hypothetical protein
MGAACGNISGIPDGHRLEIENLGFGRKIDQMRAAVQDHVGEELRLVNLTSFDAGNSDPDGHFIFDKIGQVVVGTVPGKGFYGHVARFVGPGDSAVDKKQVHIVRLRVSNLCKLKTPGRLLVVILAQNKQEIGHFDSPQKWIASMRAIGSPP